MVVGFTSEESWTLAVSVTRLVLVSALMLVLLLRKQSHLLDSLLTSLRVTRTTPISASLRGDRMRRD